jgi:hypothetical protein
MSPYWQTLVIPNARLKGCIISIRIKADKKRETDVSDLSLSLQRLRKR